MEWSIISHLSAIKRGLILGVKIIFAKIFDCIVQIILVSKCDFTLSYWFRLTPFLHIFYLIMSEAKCPQNV